MIGGGLVKVFKKVKFFSLGILIFNSIRFMFFCCSIFLVLIVELYFVINVNLGKLLINFCKIC